MKILLVDDSPILLARLVYHISEVPGVHIVGTAVDGADGLEMFERRKPDLVITDIRMPKMTGIELCQALKSSSPAPRVFIFTNFADPQYRAAAMAAGADRFFEKYTEMEQMLDLISADARADNGIQALR